MILLEKKLYWKVTEELGKVKINNLFARSVAEKHVNGKIYVDDPESPRTFYIVHSYNMSLLFGHCDNEKFNQSFFRYAYNSDKIRSEFEWMQAYPFTWDKKLSELFNGKTINSSENQIVQNENLIEIYTRVNFKFNPNKYFENKELKYKENLKIVRTDDEIFKKMDGKVVPKYFWNNADDFVKNGIGFSLFENKRLASTAFSAFAHDNLLEIGIETLPEFNRKGYAQIVCSALIDYCLENNLEPIWSCRLENTSSYYLAQKLGFEPTVTLPFYRLAI